MPDQCDIGKWCLAPSVSLLAEKFDPLAARQIGINQQNIGTGGFLWTATFRMSIKRTQVGIGIKLALVPEKLEKIFKQFSNQLVLFENCDPEHTLTQSPARAT